jgi:hypothetical protein
MSNRPKAGALPRFRPASQADFTRYARHLGELLGLKLQPAQQILAKIYGYSDLHELQAVLNTPGEPGPYEDQLDLALPDSLAELLLYDGDHDCPRGFLEIVDERCLRRSQQIEAVLRHHLPPPESEVAEQARSVVASAGLFCTPRAHRESMVCVRTALIQLQTAISPHRWALLSLRSHVANASIQLVQVDVQALRSEKGESSGFHTSPPLDPTGFIRRIASHRAALLYAQYLALIGDEDPAHPWLDGVNHDRYMGEASPSLSSVLCRTIDDESMLHPDLAPGYAAEPHWESDASACDQWHRDIRAFVNNPSVASAGKHSLLKLIPDPVSFVHQWRANRFIACITGSSNPIGDAYIKQFDLAGRRHLCVASFIENIDTANGSLGPLHYHEYVSVLFRRKDDGGGWLGIGSLSGVYIECSDHQGEMLGDTDLMWALDAHSALLNDVWKVLQFEYARSKGYASFTEFLRNDVDDDSRAVAVVHATLVPGERGKGLLAPMINSFSRTITEGERVSDFCTPSYFGSEIDTEEFLQRRGNDDDEEGAGHDHRLLSPFLLVCPIEGTEPARHTVHAAHVLLVSSPRKKPLPISAQDSAVEARRLNLTKHFESLDLEDLEVVTYNPWDYPIT